MRSQSADWLWQSATYPYDKGGNILTASRNDETHTHTYGDANWADLLTAYDGQAITYDGSGNPLSYYNGTRYTFTWEEGRRLTSAVKNGSTYTYAYDLNGIRTSKVVDGVTHNYLYASGKLLRETYGDTVLDFFYDATGVPYAMNYTVGDTTTTYYYITNLQGDVIYMVDSNYNTAAYYIYDPYGKVLSASGSMGQINPLRYRGYYYDSETGLYYLQSRYYDPSICRFINADDTAYLGADGSLSSYDLFVYCANNPIIYEDQTGKALDIIWDLVSFGSSLIDVVKNPLSPTAWFSLTADAACAVVPGLTGGGGIVRFIAGADDLADAAKLVDDVVDAGKAIKSSTKLGQNLHRLYMSFKNGDDFFTNKALRKVFEEVTSHLRPDAVDKAYKILYELKPYNRESFLKAIKQLEKYLDEIPEDTSGWYVVIDMYFN